MQGSLGNLGLGSGYAQNVLCFLRNASTNGCGQLQVDWVVMYLLDLAWPRGQRQTEIIVDIKADEPDRALQV